MNQTYNVKQTCAKKAQLKLKLNSIRKRTKILLEKHNWKKFFGSNEDTCNLSWNVVKPQNLQFSDEDEHDYYDELSSTLIDYEEQQQKQIKSKLKLQNIRKILHFYFFPLSFQKLLKYPLFFKV